MYFERSTFFRLQIISASRAVSGSLYGTKFTHLLYGVDCGAYRFLFLFIINGIVMTIIVELE